MPSIAHILILESRAIGPELRASDLVGELVSEFEEQSSSESASGDGQCREPDAESTSGCNG